METIIEVYELNKSEQMFLSDFKSESTVLCDWEFESLPKVGDVLEFPTGYCEVSTIVYVMKYNIINIYVVKI